MESSNHYYRSCWGYQHVGWLIPCNFFGYFGSEACRSEVRSKIAEFWPTHSSLLVRNFLAKNNTVIMPQPSYSPVLAPCDFSLFPRLKRPVKGRRFATIEQRKTESLRELKDIPKNEYQKCFEDWKKRWHNCIISEGDYFEGENIEIHE